MDIAGAYDKIHSVLKEQMKQNTDSEANLLKKALSKFLQREATLKDASECTRILYSNNMTYDFYYRDTLIGTMIKKQDLFTDLTTTGLPTYKAVYSLNFIEKGI